MKITDEIEPFYIMALRVDFLSERWERELYAKDLMSACEWGKKIDKENERFKKGHRLIDKYNIQTKN